VRAAPLPAAGDRRRAKLGVDIEILAEVPRRLYVRLAVTPIEAMGRDFNPRDWGVTRARRQIVTGASSRPS